MPLTEKEVDKELEEIEKEKQLLKKKVELKKAREEIKQMREQVNPTFFKKLSDAGKKGDDLVADILGIPKKKKDA